MLSIAEIKAASVDPMLAKRKRFKVGYHDAVLALSPVSNNRDYTRGFLLGLRDNRDIKTGVFQAY